MPDQVRLLEDSDGDGKADDRDNCPFVSNRDQTDDDGDAVGNACGMNRIGSMGAMARNQATRVAQDRPAMKLASSGPVKCETRPPSPTTSTAALRRRSMPTNSAPIAPP